MLLKLESTLNSASTSDAVRLISELTIHVVARRESAKKKDVRIMNIEAAKAVADAIRTSLGPRGMDKMVRSSCRSPRLVVIHDVPKKSFTDPS